MKIIMFEENLFVLKQEFIPFLELFSKVFTELVNQTSYNLFGDKPSCHQGQYHTFRLSNMLYSRIAIVCLMYYTCSELFTSICFKLAIVSKAIYHRSMLLGKCQHFVHLQMVILL